MGVRSLVAVLAVVVCASCDISPMPAATQIDTSNPDNEVTNMQVIIQVAADVAPALHKRSPHTAESKEISRMIETVGLTLEPMHPGTEDASLQSFFIVEVPDENTAQVVIERLLNLKGIEAAYVKPPDEPP